MASQLLSDWTVDFGDGPRPCTVPHAWRQDVDVRWEGPAAYRTTIQVPREGGWLVFHGISYRAQVFLNDELRAEHEGIWDAFTVPLEGLEGSEAEVRIEVVKNGGPAFPVKDVASGFLPYVFHTFGGIWQPVELKESPPDLEPSAPSCRVSVKGTKIFVDRKPFYMRGVLTWGWYPELGHCGPDDELIRKEVRLAKEMGFNTIKFCLWVPPHRFFEVLEEEGMFAWLELPLWDPSPDPSAQARIFEELRRIVLQFRRHSNIVAWTCGCELSINTTAEYRKRLYDMVKELTGAALVKDNSGSSEMYGGDLREYGDFYDFHPYCDTPFYPVVLDSLLNGPREPKPILLGEFNDVDVVKDLARIKREQPYWASDYPYLNDQGVRWEPPSLPRILRESRWAETPPPTAPEEEGVGGGGSEAAMLRHRYNWVKWNSEWKADFIRTEVHRAVRARDDIAGYVITGWRDTPISTSGMLDDWGEPKRLVLGSWNQPGLIFPIPSRRPPWINGGNRPGWIDPWNIFEGAFHVRLGGAVERGTTATLNWKLEKYDQNRKVSTAASGKTGRLRLRPCEPAALAEIDVDGLTEGQYSLYVEFGRLRFVEHLQVYKKPDFGSFEGWCLSDYRDVLCGVALPGGPNILSSALSPSLIAGARQGACAVVLLDNTATLPMPFWREAAYDWPDAPEDGPIIHDSRQLYSISGDRAIDLREFLFVTGMKDARIDMLRIDTRTYAEHPILLKGRVGKGTLVATTLRPFGGLGVQPYGVMNNPAGANLLVKLMRWAEQK